MLSVPVLDISIDYLPLRAHATDALARIAYGERLPGSVHVPVPQLGPERRVEQWDAPAGELFFGSVSIKEAAPLEAVARDVYVRVIREARDAGYPHFVRMWNYVGSLNEHDGGRERYQLFCAGRHDAFLEAGYGAFPAASAVGMPGRGLVTYFLAAREPGLQVENPRQVSAYRYPPQYGPKSPSFSRATVWNGAVFVSGTSSVVGHATAHAGDVVAQLDETVRNIDTVLTRAGSSLEHVVAAKTYIRHARDYDAIALRLEPVFRSNLYVEADICRRDLLLEIEVVAQRIV